jgi:hypothetical protein
MYSTQMFSSFNGPFLNAEWTLIGKLAVTLVVIQINRHLPSFCGAIHFTLKFTRWFISDDDAKFVLQLNLTQFNASFCVNIYCIFQCIFNCVQFGRSGIGLATCISSVVPFNMFLPDTPRHQYPTSSHT